MPGSDVVLADLRTIANELFVLAVVWHVVLAVAVGMLLRGWRPSKRTAGLLLSVPLGSVAACAVVDGNPFNGVVFVALFLLLLFGARRLDREPVAPAPRWVFRAGVAVGAFGWVYPHFLEPRPLVTYLYGAPTGLLPCPTLALVIGFSLIGGGLSSRAWTLPLVISGVFYGLYGATTLGMTMDLVLFAGAVALAASLLRVAPHPRTLAEH